MEPNNKIMLANQTTGYNAGIKTGLDTKTELRAFMRYAWADDLKYSYSASFWKDVEDMEFDDNLPMLIKLYDDYSGLDINPALVSGGPALEYILSHWDGRLSPRLTARLLRLLYNRPLSDTEKKVARVMTQFAQYVYQPHGDDDLAKIVGTYITTDSWHIRCLIPVHLALLRLEGSVNDKHAFLANVRPYIHVPHIHKALNKCVFTDF